MVLLHSWLTSTCVCVSLHSHVWFANQQFLVPFSPLLVFLHLLLPQGSRQEVGSRSEAIVKGKPLASSCYERKCIQMCFLCVRPLSSPSSALPSFSLPSHPCGIESATIPTFFPSSCLSWAFFSPVKPEEIWRVNCASPELLFSSFIIYWLFYSGTILLFTFKQKR